MRGAEAFEEWSAGAVEDWSAGAVEEWSAGAVEKWSAGAVDGNAGEAVEKFPRAGKSWNFGQFWEWSARAVGGATCVAGRGSDVAPVDGGARRWSAKGKPVSIGKVEPATENTACEQPRRYRRKPWPAAVFPSITPREVSRFGRGLRCCVGGACHQSWYR